MIIRDLDFAGIATLPSETDPILLVDPNAVLSAPTSTKPLESIPRRNRQLGKLPHPVELVKLSPCNGSQARWTTPSGGRLVDSVEKIPRSPIPEGAYHGSHYNGLR